MVVNRIQRLFSFNKVYILVVQTAVQERTEGHIRRREWFGSFLGRVSVETGRTVVEIGEMVIICNITISLSVIILLDWVVPLFRFRMRQPTMANVGYK